MAWGRSAAIAVGLATLLGACATRRLGLTWEIALLTPRVRRGSDLVFRAETKDAVGALVEGVEYVWAVDRDSARGGGHPGTSCKEQRLRIDGPKGPALLLIFSANEDGTLVEMAKAEFQIE